MTESLVDLKDVRIGYSPLSGAIYMYVPDEQGLANIKKPCEEDLLFAFIGHMLHGPEFTEGAAKNICMGTQWYTVTAKKIDAPDEETQNEL
jgi:hypothetical protein